MTDNPRKQPQSQEAWGLETLLVHGGTPALAVRRDLRRRCYLTAELRLRQRRAGRGALQERGRASSTAATPIPTVAMFEERMRLLEGARSRARHGHGHGGGDRRRCCAS